MSETTGEIVQDQTSSELDHRKHLLRDWVEQRVIGEKKSVDVDTTDVYADFSTREKAESLYTLRCTANDDISQQQSAIVAKLGLPADRKVRMLTAAEFNLLANREGWGQTNTNEWLDNSCHDSSREIYEEDYNYESFAGLCLYGGNSTDGVGAAAVGVLGDEPCEDVGWRAAVVL